MPQRRAISRSQPSRLTSLGLYTAAPSGAQLRSYDWRVGKVRAIAVAPNGLTAAAANDGAVAVWDIEE
jgi:hypothetical protein